MNRAIFDAINHWPEWLAPTMRFFSEATNWLWMKIALAVLVIALVAAKGRGRAAAFQALVAVGLANLSTDLFKHLLPMHRPFQELDPSQVVLRGGWSASMGTASAHSANMAAVAFVFTYHLRWWGSPWILVAILTGISRVYNGVHWPYQVLLGWTCGVVMGLLVTKIGDRLARRKEAKTEPEAGEPSRSES